MLILFIVLLAVSAFKSGLAFASAVFMQRIGRSVKLTWFLVLSATILSLDAGAVEDTTPKASARIVNQKGETIGTAHFEQTKREVVVTLDVKNLPPGQHGIHFHESGKCDPPDFKTAGDHFNPQNKEHGLKNPKGPHAGDLPMVTVKPDGRLKTKITSDLVTLSLGKASLLQPQRIALVIHRGVDDQRTSPSGGSGDRIACGVVREEEQ